MGIPAGKEDDDDDRDGRTDLAGIVERRTRRPRYRGLMDESSFDSFFLGGYEWTPRLPFLPFLFPDSIKHLVIPAEDWNGGRGSPQPLNSKIKKGTPLAPLLSNLAHQIFLRNAFFHSWPVR